MAALKDLLRRVRQLGGNPEPPGPPEPPSVLLRLPDNGRDLPPSDYTRGDRVCVVIFDGLKHSAALAAGMTQDAALDESALNPDVLAVWRDAHGGVKE